MTADIVVLSAVSHVLSRLKMIDERLELIDERLSDIQDSLQFDDDEDYEFPEYGLDAAVESLHSAADDIEESDIDTPNRDEVVRRLREIAESIAEGNK
jgi:hypothetical protein